MYKEDFEGFSDLLNEMTQYIINEKGLEVISEIHQKDYKKDEVKESIKENDKIKEDDTKENFTDVDFDDI